MAASPPACWRCAQGRLLPALFFDVARLQEQKDALEDLLDAVCRQGADPVDEIILVHREQLRDDNYAPLRQVRLSFIQKHVARYLGAIEVGSEGADNHGSKTAQVEDIVLDHHMRMEQTRPCSRGRTEVYPEQVSLPNHAFTTVPRLAAAECLAYGARSSSRQSRTLPPGSD